MTAYRVQLYREQRLVFRGIEADSAEQAARIASLKPTSDAQSVGELRGFDTSAVVDAEGEAFKPRLVCLRADGGPIDAPAPQVTSRMRASWAEAALSVFVQHSFCDADDAVTGLLSALLHLARQDTIYLPAALEHAFGQFEEQLKDEGQAPPHPVTALVSPRRFRHAAWQMLTALEALLPHVTQQLEEQRAIGFPAYSDFEKSVAKALAAVKGEEPTTGVRDAEASR
jgi:hypothetical protein